MSMPTEQPYLLPISYQMYEPQLSSLIAFLKTDSEKAHTIQQRLFEGDEGIIRNMLINFGNPENEEWKDFLEVLPWQIGKSMLQCKISRQLNILMHTHHLVIHQRKFSLLKAQADQAAANKQVVHKFIELFQSGKWDEFDQVIANDAVLH